MNEPTNQLNESGSNNNCEDVAGDSCNCNQRQQQHQPSPGTGTGQEREFQVLVITPKWACPCQPIDTIFVCHRNPTLDQNKKCLNDLGYL